MNPHSLNLHFSPFKSETFNLSYRQTPEEITALDLAVAVPGECFFPELCAENEEASHEEEKGILVYTDSSEGRFFSFFSSLFDLFDLLLIMQYFFLLLFVDFFFIIDYYNFNFSLLLSYVLYYSHDKQ